MKTYKVQVSPNRATVVPIAGGRPRMIATGANAEKNARLFCDRWNNESDKSVKRNEK